MISTWERRPKEKKQNEKYIYVSFHEKQKSFACLLC